MSITYITFSKDFGEQYAEYREMLLSIMESKKSAFEIFDNFSSDNLIRTKKVLKIVLDVLELQSKKSMFGDKIPFKTFERENVTKDEAESILSRTGYVKIKNDDLHKTTESKTLSSNVMIPSVGLSLGESLTSWQKNLRKDLENYLFLEIKNLDGLKKLKEHIDKKINPNPDPNDLTQKTDEELKNIIRGSADNAHIPSSIHHRAKQELEFRNIERNNNTEKPPELLTTPAQITEIEKAIKESETKIPQFPIPKNTRWEEITIKFKNEFDVDVGAKGKTYSSDYEKMGFADKRIKKSKEKAKTHNDWTFLILLSTQEGIFPLDSLQTKERKQKIKQKQSLSKKLVEAFPQIKDTDPDPFYGYNDIEKNYKIKIKLIPIPTFRDDYRDKDINYDSDDELGIKDSYDELTDNR